MNPAMFSRRVDMPFAKWFDIAVWGGVLMVSGYATGTLYERNQRTLREMEDGYDGMLVILQDFLANQKYSETHAYRIAMCATRIAEGVGLDAGSVEDIRMAALLFNMKDMGISNEVLCKAAQVSHEDLHQAIQNREKMPSKAVATVVPYGGRSRFFLSERMLRQNGGTLEDSSLEVQILVLAEEYEALTSGQRGAKMSPSQAEQEVIKRAGERHDSLVVNGFTRAFGGQAAAAGA
jgi:HD-GYP domain-containing protein (c-di-GMP phosphodiesterase class II)